MRILKQESLTDRYWAYQRKNW